LTLYRLEDILSGDLDELVETLERKEKEQSLKDEKVLK
jgi:protein subunit release factor A